ncbi:MAG TPA: BolA family protein [Oligoflexia bacterium]|nr:BolA family protein [Oligoflexia bacterium]
MNATQLKNRIETLAAGTQVVELVDLTGTQDHWQALIVSPAFEGKTMIQQHRMVFELLKDEVASNEVHALTLRTFTPAQFEKGPRK